MSKKIFSLILTLSLFLSFTSISVLAENSSEDTSNLGILEILTCTDGYTSLPVGTYTYSADINEVISLIPNVGFHVYGVEINGEFSEIQGDTATVPISVGSKVTLRPVFRGNIIFNLEQTVGGTLFSDKTASTGDPEKTAYVGTGKYFDMTAKPDVGYTCTGIYVNNESVDITKEGSVYKGSYKALEEAEYNVYATFEPITPYTATLTKNEGGTVIPFNEEGKATVYSGSDAQFQIIPDDGYGIKKVTVNDKEVSWSANGIVTVKNVLSDISLNVEFSPMKSIPVSIISSGNGTVSLVEKAYENSTIVLDILPEDGYELVYAKINEVLTPLNQDGKLEIAVTDELFQSGKIDIEVYFDVIVEKFVIRTIVNNSTGGSISAEGYIIKNLKIDVRQGSDVTLKFTPDLNYQLYKLEIDGIQVQVSEDSTYTFKNISNSYTVRAYFRSTGENYCEITATASVGGKIELNSIQIVAPGDDSLPIKFVADNGYVLDYIIIDGERQEYSENEYVFKDVTESHTLEAVFKKIDSDDSIWSDSEIKIDITSSATISKEFLAEIRENAPDKKIYFIGDGYTWIIEKGINCPDESLDLSVSIGESFFPNYILEALESKMVQSKIKGLNYAAIKTSGKIISSDTSLTLYLGSDFINKKLDYLYYDTTSNEFSSIDADITVGTDRKTIIPYEGHEYIILVEKNNSKFKVNIIAGEHGSVSPNGEMTADINNTIQMRVDPDDGYCIESIKYNGAFVHEEYYNYKDPFLLTLGTISEDITVEITFAKYDVEVITTDDTTPAASNKWKIALIIIAVSLLGGVALFIYKWNEEKDII